MQLELCILSSQVGVELLSAKSLLGVFFLFVFIRLSILIPYFRAPLFEAFNYVTVLFKTMKHIFIQLLFDF